ncbi:MAG: ATP-binding cassette domain-containing protein [Roseburia sp.]
MRQLYKELYTRYRREIFVSITMLILTSLLSILGPLILKEILESNIKNGIIIYIAMITLLFITKFLYNKFRFWFEEKFKNTETVNLYNKIFSMYYDKINEIEPTYITERVNGTINTIFNLYSSSISGIFVSALTMLLILLIICQINMVLAFLYFLQIPIQYIGFQRMLNGENSKLSEYGILLQEISARNNKNIKAMMSDVSSIKQYSGNDGIITFIKRNVIGTNKIARKGNSYAMDVCTILEYICQIIKNMSYILIIYLFVSDLATVGDIVYLNLMNDIYYGAINDVINIQVNLRDLKAAMKFIVEEVQKNKEEDGDIELEEICDISGTIKDVGYAGNTLIKEGSFKFGKGDIIAISGASGVGKTTFVKLLNKFIKSDDIYINGENINRIKNSSLRERVYFLPQNAYLLPLSIKENITLGKNFSKNRWDKLLEMSFMKKFLQAKGGLDELVYENGANLSGGDRQKIILARIFLRNPDVIILDESFNSIDEKTGNEIIDQILSQYSDRIVIVISHSEKYLKKCNFRINIENKKLVQIAK